MKHLLTGAVLLGAATWLGRKRNDMHYAFRGLEEDHLDQVRKWEDRAFQIQDELNSHWLILDDIARGQKQFASDDKICGEINDLLVDLTDRDVDLRSDMSGGSRSDGSTVTAPSADYEIRKYCGDPNSQLLFGPAYPYENPWNVRELEEAGEGPPRDLCRRWASAHHWSRGVFNRKVARTWLEADKACGPQGVPPRLSPRRSHATPRYRLVKKPTP